MAQLTKILSGKSYSAGISHNGKSVFIFLYARRTVNAFPRWFFLITAEIWESVAWVPQETANVTRKRVIYCGSIFKLFWKVMRVNISFDVAHSDVNAICCIRKFTCYTVNDLRGYTTINAWKYRLTLGKLIKS